VTGFRHAAATAALCCATGVVCLPVSAQAPPPSPQAAADASLDRIKSRLDRPPVTLKPSVPVQLRPTFRSEVDRHPFVPTLDEDLRRTFELTDWQRLYAEYRARCCGIGIGDVVTRLDRALDERRTRKVREEIARELRDLEAARATAVR
jgi:hypothetical protein